MFSFSAAMPRIFGGVEKVGGGVGGMLQAMSIRISEARRGSILSSNSDQCFYSRT
jgi:hypothetical protein